MKFKTLLLSLFLGLVVVAGWAANNMGDNQSIAVRRPPNEEFVAFSVTNGQTSALVWTSQLNRVSGTFVSSRSALGVAQTNTMTVVASGSVVTLSVAGAYTNGQVNLLMEE